MMSLNIKSNKYKPQLKSVFHHKLLNQESSVSNDTDAEAQSRKSYKRHRISRIMKIPLSARQSVLNAQTGSNAADIDKNNGSNQVIMRNLFNGGRKNSIETKLGGRIILTENIGPYIHSLVGNGKNSTQAKQLLFSINSNGKFVVRDPKKDGTEKETEIEGKALEILLQHLNISKDDLGEGRSGNLLIIYSDLEKPAVKNTQTTVEIIEKIKKVDRILLRLFLKYNISTSIYDKIVSNKTFSKNSTVEETIKVEHEHYKALIKALLHHLIVSGGNSKKVIKILNSIVSENNIEINVENLYTNEMEEILSDHQTENKNSSKKYIESNDALVSSDSVSDESSNDP
ncbi:unnamed protein product, partial [Leptidea sinapis]